MTTFTSSRLLSLGICFLALFNGCLAQLDRRQQQHPPPRAWSECRIERIIARQPNRSLKSEAGLSEFWESNGNDELECAGVEAVRHTIQPRGLLLPYYPNAPELVFVVRGRGMQGTVLPGCPETFETSFPSESEGGGRTEFFDKHQRVYRFREGDILALPAGTVHWTYNDGDTPITAIVLRDRSNAANQLDRNFMKFFLAGNPQSQRVEQVRRGQQEQEHGQGGRRWEEPEGGRARQQPWKGEGQEAHNIFNGIADEILQEVYKIGSETVRQIKGQTDERGLIVHAENFQVVSPQYEEEGGGRWKGSKRGGSDNGMEETICSAKLRANIANPAHADVYNPRGGRVTSLNSHKLPVLSLLQLSAERGILYQNAVLAPHYNLNSHSIIYVTNGSGRLQIVRNDGKAVFDGEVREGELIVVPQDFAVVKKASDEGLEWVAFKTNDNAVTTQLAGRFSFIRALPEDVVVNSYEISREQARSLKYNRQEGVVLSPASRSPREKGMNAVLNVLFS